MSQEAKISSVVVLKQLRASLGTFAGTASAALDEAGTEIQRVTRWLEQDCYRHWKVQVQVRSEQFTCAKLALKGRQVLDRTLAGTPSSCVDERKALKIAEARLREAEHKFQRVKAWSLRLEKQMSDYRGAVQQLVEAIDVNIPNARAKLDKMIDSLEAYLALAPPEMPGTTAEKAEAVLVPPADIAAPSPAETQPAASGSPEEDRDAKGEAAPTPPERKGVSPRKSEKGSKKGSVLGNRIKEEIRNPRTDPLRREAP
jgi:hypothetical protein